MPGSECLRHGLRTGPLTGPSGRLFKSLSTRLRACLAALLLTAVPALTAAQPAPPSVGLTRLDLGGLPVTLVYPSDTAAAPLRQGSFELNVALDGAPQPGVRRLVVLSHGTGGSDLADHGLAATLARAGFVVAQPLHQADSYRDTSRAGPQAWQTRPLEVLQVVDALAAHPQWQQRLALDRVGVHGMSAGGGTALSLAGGRWRTLNLVRHCLAQGEQDPGFCYNGLPDAQAQAARRARFENARGVPELFLPSELKTEHGGRADAVDPRMDARIAAVTVAVPVAAPFSAESLKRIRVPLGVVSAGRDTLLMPAWHSSWLLQHCSACQLLQDLPQAGHFDLLQPWPADVARRIAQQQPQGGWPEAGFDPAERQRAFEAIAAFHQRWLQR